MTMNPMIIPIVAIIFIFGVPVIAGIILGLKYMNNKHAERMGLIDQGIIPPQKERRKATPSRLVALRNGIVLLSLGLGLVVGFILVKILNFSLMQLVYLNMMLGALAIAFLGIGYLIYFWVSRDMYDNEKREDSDNNELA